MSQMRAGLVGIVAGTEQAIGSVLWADTEGSSVSSLNCDRQQLLKIRDGLAPVQ